MGRYERSEKARRKGKAKHCESLRATFQFWLYSYAILLYSPPLRFSVKISNRKSTIVQNNGGSKTTVGFYLEHKSLLENK